MNILYRIGNCTTIRPATISLFFIFLILLITQLYTSEADGYPIQSPTGINNLDFYKSTDYAYFNELYYSDFDSYHDIDWVTGGTGSIVNGQANSYIGTQSYQALATAFIFSDDIGLGWEDYHHHGVTIIELEFEPANIDYQGWMEDHDADGYYEDFGLFTIIGGPGFGFHLKDERKVFMSRWVEVPGPAMQVQVIDYEIMQLSTSKHSIVIHVYDVASLRHIRLYVDGNYKYGTNVDYRGEPGLGYSVGFGDNDDGHGDAAKGGGKWYSISVLGHYNDDLRFFDNFNDGSATNWRQIHNNVNDAKWDVNSNGELHLTSSQNLNHRCNGQSPFIDYIEDDEPYFISFDFKFTSVEDTFIMFSNNEIILLLDKGELKGEKSDATLEWIADLTSNEWHHIRISKIIGIPPIEDHYRVLIDRSLGKNFCYLANENDGTNFISVGDFGGDHIIHDAYWDNIFIDSQTTVGTSGYSADFQSDEHIPLFIEDFEEMESVNYKGTSYSIDMEEWKWWMDPTPEGDTGQLWELGKDNTLLPHTGDSAMVTDINNNYPAECTQRFVTPPIRMDTISSATISFWINYRTHSSDGLRVEYRQYNTGTNSYSNNGDWTAIGLNDANFYNSNNVAAWNNGAAFSGNSGGMTFEVTNLPNECFGANTRAEFAFTFSSDFYDHGQGVAIDDIKIHGTDDDANEDDFDDDGMNNRVEHYIFQCSPMVKDTDWDGIWDQLEVSTEITDKTTWGKTKLSKFKIDCLDPNSRDIVIEIDAMKKSDGTKMYPDKVNDLIETDFPSGCTPAKGVIQVWGEHGYNFRKIDGTLNIDYVAGLRMRGRDPGDDDDLTDYQEDHKDPALENVAYWAFFAGTFSNAEVYGINHQGNSHAVFAVASMTVKDYNPYSVDWKYKAVNTFSHELGHCMGMAHYTDEVYNNPTECHVSKDWNPDYPGYCSLSRSTTRYGFSYLEETSNTECDWTDTQLDYYGNDIGPEEDHSDEIFGGWEYGALWDPNTNNIIFWFTGMYFDSVRDF